MLAAKPWIELIWPKESRGGGPLQRWRSSALLVSENNSQLCSQSKSRIEFIWPKESRGGGPLRRWRSSASVLSENNSQLWSQSKSWIEFIWPKESRGGGPLRRWRSSASVLSENNSQLCSQQNQELNLSGPRNLVGAVLPWAGAPTKDGQPANGNFWNFRNSLLHIYIIKNFKNPTKFVDPSLFLRRDFSWNL